MRAATITAVGALLQAICLTADAFAALGLEEKVNFGQRQAVQAEKVEVYSGKELEKVAKTPEVSGAGPQRRRRGTFRLLSWPARVERSGLRCDPLLYCPVLL